MRAAAALESDAPALPPLFRHHVRRPRLTRLLDACTAPVIVLAAPAGYGKTTLAAEWLQGRPEEEVAWYYASPASADVAALSVGIADAVSHILPAGDRVRQRLRVPEVPDNQADILAELLAHDLTAWPEHAWLVLDDYHHAMESESAERFVEELVRLAPIRLLITSRRRPSWVTARRVVYGKALEIGQEQLSMTRKEADSVLKDRNDRATSPHINNESWPAVLGLAASTDLAQRPGLTLEGTLFRFFAEEILNQAPPLEQAFLLLASLPSYLSPAVMDVLPLDADARESLVPDLQERGLLHADGRANVRLHPLLREFLLKRALSVEPADRDLVVDGAFSAFLDAEDWDAAFDLAVDARRPDLVASAVKVGGSALLRSGRLSTLEAWLGVVDRTDGYDPELLLLQAEVDLRNGRFSQAAALSRHAVDLLGPHDSRAPKACSVLGAALHMRCDYSGALRAYEHAYMTAKVEEDRLQASWGRLIATVEAGREDPTGMVKDFEALASPTPDHRLRLICGRMMAAERGGKRLPLNAYREALTLVSMADDPMAISHAYATGIFAHARRGAYQEALAIAKPAVEYCSSLHLAFPLAYCIAYRAQAEIGCRRLSAARSSLAELVDRIEAIEDAHLSLVYEALRVKLAIASGSVSPTAVDASVKFALGEEVPDWPLADLIAVEALVLAARGDSTRVHERLERLSTLMCGPTAEACVTLARLISQDQDSIEGGSAVPNASGPLRQIIRLQCLDAFVTAYRAYPRLLRLILTDPSLERPVRAIVAASDDWRLAEGTPLAPHQAPGSAIHSLTRREAEVASLIAAGLSNPEIASELFIAHSTAKVHVRHVLRKLHTRTRLEAALVWRDAQSEVKQR